MNYLAHLFLADDTDESRIGNLLADFTRVSDERACEVFGSAIGQAVRHHRRVDAFTDQHPAVHACVQRLFSRHRHASGIIVDILFDHLLIRNWQRFAPYPLAALVDKAHAALAALEQRPEPFPDRFRLFARRFVVHKVLPTYASLDGVRLALERTEKRLSSAHGLVSAMETIERDLAFFDERFLAFFPQLLAAEPL